MRWVGWAHFCATLSAALSAGDARSYRLFGSGSGIGSLVIEKGSFGFLTRLGGGAGSLLELLLVLDRSRLDGRAFLFFLSDGLLPLSTAPFGLRKFYFPARVFPDLSLGTAFPDWSALLFAAARSAFSFHFASAARRLASSAAFTIGDFLLGFVFLMLAMLGS